MVKPNVVDTPRGNGRVGGRPTPVSPNRNNRQGTALTLLIILLVVTTIGLSIAVPRAHHSVRQQKGDETRAILAEYRRAGERFQQANGRPPTTYQEMLADTQGRHFLRRLYRDPNTGLPEWGLRQTASETEFFSLASAPPVFPLD